MDLTITPEAQLLAVAALILGLVLGYVMRGGLARKLAVMSERADALARERDALVQDREKLAVEVKAREAQIRPLADELDKLRRDFARAQARLANDAPARVAADVPHAVLDDVHDARRVDPRDLSVLKGVGPKFADRLRGAGITGIDQIAGWTPVDADIIDGQMGDYKGRIASDRLVEQARLLTEGRYTEYETVFGKLGR